MSVCRCRLAVRREDWSKSIAWFGLNGASSKNAAVEDYLHLIDSPVAEVYILFINFENNCNSGEGDCSQLSSRGEFDFGPFDLYRHTDRGKCSTHPY